MDLNDTVSGLDEETTEEESSFSTEKTKYLNTDFYMRIPESLTTDGEGKWHKFNKLILIFAIDLVLV